MTTPLTAEQRRMLGKLVEGKVSIEKALPVIGHLTDDDIAAHLELLRAEFDAYARRHEELSDASLEVVRLMREHGCETAGELDRLGIRNPYLDVASRILDEHEAGLISDDELRQLGIARDLDGEIVLVLSPLALLTPEGHG